jgi:hypothetical protein
MFLDDEWEKITKGLPRPLTVTSVRNPKTGKRVRHFKVLAMTYTEGEKKNRRTVSISRKFQDL